MTRLRIASWVPVWKAWHDYRAINRARMWIGFSLMESAAHTRHSKVGTTVKMSQFASNDSAAVCCRNKPFRGGRSAGWRHLRSKRHFALWCIERGYQEAARMLFNGDNELLRYALAESEVLS